MTELDKIQKIYFIGIGGIGMSALARYFRFHGKSVSGYDRTESALTRALVNEGIPVHYEDRPDLVPGDADLVVFTPAVPADMQELRFFMDGQYEVMKRSEVLGLITRSSFNICVAGTHGKTTISTMIAHILRDSGYGCNAFLGGISVNYQSNFWSDKRNLCVVEADEYDRSFLRLNPDIAVISAMDPDHLDIYGTAGAVEEAFIEFSAKLKPGGVLFCKYELSRRHDLQGRKQKTYSLTSTEADFHVAGLRAGLGGYQFDIRSKDWRLEGISLPMGGLHNVENAAAAIAVAHEIGIADDKILKAIGNFRGVKRRFEFVLGAPGDENFKGTVFIDDYAHHPEELKALISSARRLFPARKCTVIFQPHLYSRTRDFAEGFGKSLDLADEVILLPLYPAREMPLAGISSQTILDKMNLVNKRIMNKQELMNWLEMEPLELLVTAGAGDIDGLVEPIRSILEKRN